MKTGLLFAPCRWSTCAAWILQFIAVGDDRVAISQDAKLVVVNLGELAEFPVEITIHKDGRIALRFDSTTGSQYHIETSPELTGGNWSIMAEKIAGTGSVVEVLIPDPLQRQAFYRVVQDP